MSQRTHLSPEVILGGVIGGAGIIGIGGEKWRKGEDRSEIWNISYSQLRGRKERLYIVQNFPN